MGHMGIRSSQERYASVGLKLKVKAHERLLVLSTIEGKPPTDIIKEAIAAYLNKKEDEVVATLTRLSESRGISFDEVRQECIDIHIRHKRQKKENT